MAEFLKKASGSLQTMPEFITVFILYKRRITSKQMHHKSYQTEEKSHQMPRNSVKKANKRCGIHYKRRLYSLPCLRTAHNTQKSLAEIVSNRQKNRIHAQ